MINNFKCYCISSNDPARYSVKVTNFTDLCVRFILKYTIYEGTALKEIDLLKNQNRKFYYENAATNVSVNILDCSSTTTKLIYHECIVEKTNLCFEISGTPQRIICARTIC
ncbi:hypothetical protein FDJ70_09915 [Clostridium botulinum]|uniref:Uncharacterized protein n=2 Tax=Clostridium botulinum TaxID=1491 RepID=C4IXM5_CLOBO|nr:MULTISPECIES: hypothetical protein [Clostridium]ACT33656.1 hypothetical protein CLG_0031 [Clostridium botulinum D str. 1873]MBO3441496.1 hypothetical protein [Clostridium haemolyticum]MCD3217288.1 hypothetical protein [Clostridium botulinum C]NFV47967.1 hypothetical protein [Clostridium botulinum]BAH29575.1 hypothetical protein [Clostridium botulinum]